MRFVKQGLDFYLNSSIHVALAVMSLSWITLLEFDVPYDKDVLCFVFFSTIAGYNFVKYFGMAKFYHRRLISWLMIIQVFSLCCFVALFYYAFQLNPKTMVYVFAAALITFLYAIPFLPRRLFIDKQHNLRSVGGLKIYVIALVWTGVTVFIPLINNDFQINLDVFITSLQRFLFVIVLMFPFEIRDMQFDNLKLSTVPQKIGVRKTKTIGVFLLVAFFFMEFLKDDVILKRTLILMILTGITFLFLIFSEERRSKYYSSFWVEGLPILWLLLMLF